jgi:succinate dehydrogenase/fumarate reductase flavoprotein subunit
LADFASMPEEWGYPGATIRDRVAEFNAAVRADAETAPGRLLDRQPLDEPPFYVVEAAPAITFTFGGLLIDAEARVRSADTQGAGPVPGLLAAGADAGGLYRRAYAGGLAPALVFGLAAARTALAGAPAVPAR